MRKLLQNKTVVASLAVVAMLCIAGNFLKWPAPKDMNVAARSDETIQTVSPVTFPAWETAKVVQSLPNWSAQHPSQPAGRDPFRRVLKPANNLTESALPRFTVQAVSIDGNKALAVVNRTIVRTGDTISAYLVVRIAANAVHLQGAAGEIVVPVHSNADAKNKGPIVK